MNNIFLQVVKSDLYSFIKNATLDDCKLVMANVNPAGFYDWVKQLREKAQDPVLCLLQFPDQATPLPAVSFVMGSINAQQEMQSYGLDDGSMTEDEMSSFQHLAATLSDHRVSITRVRAYLHTGTIMIGVYALNKFQTNWLMHLVDFIIRSHQMELAHIGLFDSFTSYSEVRLQQELFPLAVPSRMITVNFKYQKFYPVLDQKKRAPYWGELGMTPPGEHEPLPDNIDTNLILETQDAAGKLTI